jgi:hypothetical protein
MGDHFPFHILRGRSGRPIVPPVPVPVPLPQLGTRVAERLDWAKWPLVFQRNPLHHSKSFLTFCGTTVVAQHGAAPVANPSGQTTSWSQCRQAWLRRKGVTSAKDCRTPAATTARLSVGKARSTGADQAPDNSQSPLLLANWNVKESPQGTHKHFTTCVGGVSFLGWHSMPTPTAMSKKSFSA